MADRSADLAATDEIRQEGTVRQIATNVELTRNKTPVNLFAAFTAKKKFTGVLFI